MPTFPTFDRAYAIDGYSYSFEPEVSRVQFYSGAARQRKRFDKDDYRFSVNILLSDAEMNTFEDFVTVDLKGGENTYTGPYFTGDVEYTGTLEMIDGSYSASLVPPNHWRVSFEFELKDRDFTEEDNIYASVNALGTFENSKNVLDALENMVNNNNL